MSSRHRDQTQHDDEQSEVEQGRMPDPAVEAPLFEQPVQAPGDRQGDRARGQQRRDEEPVDVDFPDHRAVSRVARGAATRDARARTGHGGSRPMPAGPRRGFRWRYPRHHPDGIRGGGKGLSDVATRVAPVPARPHDPLGHGVQGLPRFHGQRWPCSSQNQEVEANLECYQRIAEAPCQRRVGQGQTGYEHREPVVHPAFEVHAVKQGVVGSKPGEITPDGEHHPLGFPLDPRDRPSRIPSTATPTPRLRAMAPFTKLVMSAAKVRSRLMAPSDP